mgnify:FL=1
MPLYDYECLNDECKHVEKDISVPHKEKAYLCPKRKKQMERLFPVEAVNGIRSFESYYDPALDMDITGPKQRADAIRALGLVEKGDMNKGARNWDSSAPSVMDVEAPKGRTLNDLQREQEGRQKIKESFIVGDETGNFKRASELSGPERSTSSGDAIIDEAMK